MVAAAPAAPLLTLGPPGWALYAAVVAGSAIVTALALRRASQAAEEAFSDTVPGCTQGCSSGSEEKPPRKKDKPPPVIPPIPIWKPVENETHPDHDDVKEAMEEGSNDCGKIGLAIDTLVRDLRFRRWDMQRHGGGDKGHRDAYYKRRDALRRLVSKARELGCPYNPEADVEIERPHTFPTPHY
jgi:hypothetical protein